MAVFSSGAGITQQYVTNNAQQKLATLRNALEDCSNMHLWLSGLAVADLVNLGFSTADAQAIMTALADADALYQVYLTGQAPGTYPQVASPYPYGASQRAIVGPLN